ncbi:MAG: N-acetylmuramoyl-L-alanine amidase [Prevotella sp.]|nr:N-acetylmuramoyl-L-alanine amidase [Prevotella sp.]
MLKRIYTYITFLLLGTVIAMAAPHRFTLVIDAGHGGKDAGAVGAFSKEKDINLRTALAFGGYVERNCPDVRVIYTRKTDVFVTLYDRAEIANKAKADLFISIHTNALAKNHVARGLETYTLGMHRAGDNLEVAKRENSVILVENNYKERYEGFDPNSAESYIMFEFMQDHNMARSVELAKYVQNNVCSAANRPDKGVKQAGFLVLRETSMPSCLIELGFISTPAEEQLLNNETHINNMARGIYQAFVAYKNRYDGNAVIPSKVIEPENTSSPIVSQEPAPKKEPVPTKKAEQKKEVSQEKKSNTNAPVFKVQIFVSDQILKEKDSRLKGEKAEYYKEGKTVKYTIGSSTNYNEIYKLRKTLLDKFPQAFIIAFKNDEKMNINEAIKEFKERK